MKCPFWKWIKLLKISSFYEIKVFTNVRNFLMKPVEQGLGAASWSSEAAAWSSSWSPSPASGPKVRTATSARPAIASSRFQLSPQLSKQLQILIWFRWGWQGCLRVSLRGRDAGQGRSTRCRWRREELSTRTWNKKSQNNHLLNYI